MKLLNEMGQPKPEANDYIPAPICRLLFRAIADGRIKGDRKYARNQLKSFG